MPDSHYTGYGKKGNGQTREFPSDNAHLPPHSRHSYTDKPKRILSFIKNEWKWLFALVFPLLLGGGWLALPASTAQVEKVKATAASDVALVKTELTGQIQHVNGRIDDLKSDLKAFADETRADIKELLKRTPAQSSEFPYPPQKAASAPPALPAPAAIPPKKHQPKKIVSSTCSGILCAFSR